MYNKYCTLPTEFYETIRTEMAGVAAKRQNRHRDG
jgi:hypothetical protein